MNEHPVELSIYGDGRLELDISLTRYDHLNNSAIATEGKNLIELAEADPSLTYALLRRMVGSLAMNTTDLSINDRLIATKQDDGEEAITLMARNALIERMPASYEKPVQFSLGIYPSDDDKLLLGDSVTRIPVLELTVEPPDYA